MRVLLTGVTGFVGSHVARVLLREGCEVQTIMRPGRNPWRIVDLLSKLRPIQGDFLHLESLEESIASFKPELCIHLGWSVEPGNYLHNIQNIDLMVGTLKLA